MASGSSKPIPLPPSSDGTKAKVVGGARLPWTARLPHHSQAIFLRAELLESISFNARVRARAHAHTHTVLLHILEVHLQAGFSSMIESHPEKKKKHSISPPY